MPVYIGPRRSLIRTAEPEEPADFYVKAFGSDSNVGSSRYPFATLAKALLVATIGQTIGLDPSIPHPTNGTSTIISDVNVISTSRSRKAILDARQDLSSKVWTFQGGSTWKTTVTFRNATVPGGVGSNTTNAGIWVNEVFYAWQVGGADIAANIAAVDAAPGSFAINKTGSTEQDIRSAASGAATAFDLYIHMADGSNPNGQPVKVADQTAVCLFQGGYHKRLSFKGSFGKDSVGVPSYSGNVPSFENCESVDFGEHGWVGPMHVFGIWTSSSKPRPGTPGFAKGRGNGAGVNLYSNVYRSTLDLTLGTIQCFNCSIALYDHGSGNQSYRNVTVDEVIADNCTKGVVSNPVPVTFLPMFAGTYTIGKFTGINIDEAYECDGAWVIGGGGGGSISYDPNPLSTTRQFFVNFVGAAPSLSIIGGTVDFTLTVTAGKSRLLAGRSTSNAFTDPVLTLTNFTDISAAGKKGQLQRGGTANIQSQIAIDLVNTKIGDIMDQAAGTNWPARLTSTGAVNEVGAGDRTGPQIEAGMAGAGRPCTLDHNTTTIKNRAGGTTSTPPW